MCFYSLIFNNQDKLSTWITRVYHDGISIRANCLQMSSNISVQSPVPNTFTTSLIECKALSCSWLSKSASTVQVLNYLYWWWAWEQHTTNPSWTQRQVLKKLSMLREMRVGGSTHISVWKMPKRSLLATWHQVWLLSNAYVVNTSWKGQGTRKITRFLTKKSSVTDLTSIRV